MATVDYTKDGEEMRVWPCSDGCSAIKVWAHDEDLGTDIELLVAPGLYPAVSRWGLIWALIRGRGVSIGDVRLTPKRAREVVDYILSKLPKEEMAG